MNVNVGLWQEMTLPMRMIVLHEAQEASNRKWLDKINRACAKCPLQQIENRLQVCAKCPLHQTREDVIMRIMGR